MMLLSRSSLNVPFALCLAAAAACGKDDAPPPQSSCSFEAQTGCPQNQVCEHVEGGSTACFAPLAVEGRVVKASDGATGIANALVVARDVNGAMASLDVAKSAADGAYHLKFPAQRKTDGTPSVDQFTLRADALGFATYPSGLRVALPIDTANVAKQ